MGHTKQFTRQILFIVVSMTLLLGFGIDLYTPSFPLIAKTFQTTQQLVQLTIATYFYGYMLGLILIGPISDAVGRRKPLIYGLLFYCLVSLLCTFATNIQTLLALRFFQGVGVASVGIMFRSILSDAFTGKKLATSMTYTSMSYRLGPIIAPVIGGYLSTYFGWTSNFYFLMTYGALLTTIVYFFLPETHTELFPINLKYILKKYASILKCLPFLGGAICVGILYAMMIIFNVVGPFFIQDILGYSPIFFGNIAFSMGVFAFLGILCNRLLIHFFSPKKIIHFGMIAAFLLCILQTIAAFFFSKNIYAFTIPVALNLFATGLIVSNVMSQSLESITHGKGSASGVFGTILIATTSTLTTLSSFLRSNTIIPFALGYMAMITLTLVSYFFLFKRRC